MKSFLKKIVVYILTLEAKLVLKRYKPKVIAVTGNVGKTSTKDAIYTSLCDFISVRKNQKSFNSEIGVPLTILGLENAWGNPLKWLINIFKGAGVCVWQKKYPEWLILEIGADHPGDIESITKWLIPDVVVITRIPGVPVHVEYFKDSNALMEEKAFLLKALREDGAAILNADDENILALGKYVKGTVIHYGMKNPATIYADKYGLMYDGDYLAGMQFRILYDSNIIPVVLKGVVGIQHVYPVLASACVGIVLKMPLVKLTESFLNHEYPRGRMNVLRGINNTVIIDDTYNSSPVAVEFALKTLKEVLVKGRKIAVLGDMLELGSHSVSSHKEAGKLVADCADVLLTVGVRARDFKESAMDSGMSKNSVWSFHNSNEAGEFLKDFIKEGDLILVKGSQGVRMEKAVSVILEDKENIGKLLIRQEGEWQVR
ncbi:MAG: UDP-N-acetylmuramoyl-tripeptide--D-alanyl-D-alanine ligase [bacterium]